MCVWHRSLVYLFSNIFDSNFPTHLIILITRNPIRDQGKRFVGPFEYLRVNADLSKEGILTEKSGENVKEMLWSSVSRWHKSALGESVISKLPRQQLS